MDKALLQPVARTHNSIETAGASKAKKKNTSSSKQSGVIAIAEKNPWFKFYVRAARKIFHEKRLKEAAYLAYHSFAIPKAILSGNFLKTRLLAEKMIAKRKRARRRALLRRIAQNTIGRFAKKPIKRPGPK